jgi:hypothetical protein
MKKLIFILSFFLLNSAFAQDTNLLCDITLREDDDGRITSQKIKTRVEISVYPDKTIFIRPDYQPMGSVSNIKNPNTISVIDFSNSTKWHIERTNKYENGSTLKVSYVIDRNSGTISYDAFFQMKGFFRTTGFGNCEKIDPHKKKF